MIFRHLFITIFTLTISLLADNNYYIFNIDNNCQSIFPNTPNNYFGAYKYHDTSNNILFSAKKLYMNIDSNRLSLKQNKLDFDENTKNSFKINNEQVVNFLSKFKDGIYIAEYLLKPKEGYIYGRIYYSGKYSCEWYIWSINNQNKEKAKKIFFDYKHKIKLINKKEFK